MIAIATTPRRSAKEVLMIELESKIKGEVVTLFLVDRDKPDLKTELTLNKSRLGIDLKIEALLTEAETFLKIAPVKSLALSGKHIFITDIDGFSYEFLLDDRCTIKEVKYNHNNNPMFSYLSRSKADAY